MWCQSKRFKIGSWEVTFNVCTMWEVPLVVNAIADMSKMRSVESLPEGVQATSFAGTAIVQDVDRFFYEKEHAICDS